MSVIPPCREAFLARGRGSAITLSEGDPHSVALPFQLLALSNSVADATGRSKIDADAAHRFVIGNLPHLQKSKFKAESPSSEASTSAAAVAQRQAEAAIGRTSRFKHVAQETERIVPGQRDEDDDDEDSGDDDEDEEDEEEGDDEEPGSDVEMADAEALLASVDEQIEDDSDKSTGRKRKRRPALE